MSAFQERLAERTGVDFGAYDHYIIHQASKVGLSMLLRQYGISPDKSHESLSRYGNCMSVSLAIGLEELINARGVHPGERVLLLGTAAGLSIGAMALQF